MSEDFLSRWSRLKRGAQEAPAESPEASPEPGHLASGPDEAITPEEIAALPAPDTLLPGADLAPFLRRGVPAVLRNAALRRMWALDPEIRDFVGEARDYAWDWNVAGGVPVSGPLPDGFDVEGMVRRIFGEARDDPDSDAPAAKPTPPAVAPQQLPVATLVDDRPDAVAEATLAPPAPPQANPAASPPPSRPRRHGSALPS